MGNEHGNPGIPGSSRHGERPMRPGFSTGCCAAAAAKAAAALLAGHEAADSVELEMPDGAIVVLPVESARRLSPNTATATVVKDAGDDPDITNGARVVVALEIKNIPPPADQDYSPSPPPDKSGDAAESAVGVVSFHAGAGVGVVTKPGLQLTVGEAAVNPAPRRMIAAAIRSALGDVDASVSISVPGGRELAERTFNPKLGVEGGISILGTTGRVFPKSEDAWLRSLIPQIDVATAAGRRKIYLVPGGFGESAAKEIFGAAEGEIVHCGNFVGEMLKAAASRGLERVALVGHVGKLVKVAAGIFNTHSRHGDARLETVAALAAAAGAPIPLVAEIIGLPTCQAAIAKLAAAGLGDVWDDIAERAAARAAEHAGVQVDCALVGYDGRAVIGASRGIRGEVSAAPSHHVVGVGPGQPEWLSPAAWRIIRRAAVVVGGRRQLEAFAPSGVERICVDAEIAALAPRIRAHAADKNIVVLASGDPCCFGLLATLRRELPEINWQTLPGIGSAQLALARLGESWEGVAFASVHGRPMAELIELAARHQKILALADRRNSPPAVAAALLAAGLQVEMAVLEKLGYPDERVIRGNPAAIAAAQFDPLSVVWIAKSNP